MGRTAVQSSLAAGLVTLSLLSGTGADAGPSGAIFTTDAIGSFVNGNVYDHSEDVYLNGGPRPNAPCTAAGLPDGEYYFQVTDPSGRDLLSTDDVSARQVRVENGLIVEYLGSTSHQLGEGKCGSVTVQLAPYRETTNPGGEYKVWMIPVADYVCPSPPVCQGVFGFVHNRSKTDNFKVTPPEDGGGPD